MGTPSQFKHILTECKIHDKERRKFHISNHLTEILNSEPRNVFKPIQFLSETHLLSKL